MFRAFIIDDDKYAAEATYMLFPWDKLSIDNVEIIQSPLGVAERIVTEEPDVVFIDIEMGNISGLDVIKKCKEDGCSSFFIIVSGHDNFNYAHTAINLGAIHYLLKPIDPDDIESVSKKLTHLLEEKSKSQSPASMGLPSPKNLWEKILGYIEKNYMKKLQVQDICTELYISPSTFYNAFKTNSGETFVDYLTRFRLEKAKTLLRTTDKTIPDISSLVGISNQYYFDKIFKKYNGISASDYRQSSEEEN